MRILLTGGTGLIGRALCHSWASKNHELIVWSRYPEKVERLCSGARGIASLAQLDDTKPVDAVINLAGAPIADRPWTAARRQLLWSSRVELTHQLVEWMAGQRQKPQVFISASAVGWYGDGDERILDESSLPGKTNFGSQLCMAWEQAAECARQYGIRVVLLRTAPVLSTKGGMLARLRLPFRLGLGGRIGNGQQWMPWIHIDDQVNLIDYLLHQSQCFGVLNACAPEPVRNSEFTQILAHVLHRPALLPIPAWAIRLALGEMSVLLLEGQRAIPKRALEHGFKFAYPVLDKALLNIFGRCI
jgi:uncharacterized protein (TIGR01777 family)